MLTDTFRGARERAGLTQLELAGAAGLSRATVGAVETGRHVPSVHAALELARVLGTTVEALFAAPDDAAVDVHGRTPRETRGVLVCRVGERLVCVDMDEALTSGTSWPVADAVIR